MKHKNYKNILKKIAWPASLGLIVMMLFMRISTADVYEWDEARNGVNAFEMIANGDYFNLYYGDMPDTWNSKPPLLTWLIVFSYKVLGFNELALRFPSAISTFLFFIVAFKTITLYESAQFAWITCLLLMSSKCVIGHHVGLTGDFDALFLLLISCAAYFYLLFTDFGKQYAIWLSFIFLGLAFYAKGSAVFLVFPPLIAYSLYRRNFMPMFRNTHFWLGVFAFLFIAGSWFAIVHYKGIRYHQSYYGTKNAIETLFVSDTWDRAFKADEAMHSKNGILFFLSTLDSKFNLWNYFFYLSCILLLLQKFWRNSPSPKNNLLYISFFWVLFISVLVCSMIQKNIWYLAPVFLFTSVICVNGFYILLSKYSYASRIFFSLLLIFTLGRNIKNIYDQPRSLHAHFSASKEKYRLTTFYVRDMPNQNLLLYILWSGAKIDYIFNSNFDNIAEGYLVLNKSRSFISKKPSLEYKDFVIYELPANP